MYTNDNPLKVFTTFSGYDSQCLALKKANIPFDLVGWSEIEKRAIDAHNLIFPEYKDRNYGDICKINWNNVPDFELFTYSSPCFVAGTQVWTNQGYKNIEDIVVGDEVLTHTGEYHKVIDTMSHPYAGVMYHIHTDSGSVDCTRNHPFYVYTSGNYEWVRAEDLNENSMYTCGVGLYKDGVWVHDEICGKKAYVSNDVPVVYNFEVEKDHSYIANNIVVKNCTDFSNAGLQAGGEEGSGTRSSLLWECRKTILAKKPKYLMFENVKALVSDKFFYLFNKWCKELESYGYVNYYQVLNAKDYGVPQNRERIFMISILKTEDEPDPYYEFPKPIKLKKTVENILEDDVDEKYYMSKENTDKYINILKKEYGEKLEVKNNENSLW